MEVAGLVAGALGLITVLDTLLETRGSIQRGRHFSDDFKLHTTKFDLTLVRFQRWIEGVQTTALDDILLACPQLRKLEARMAVDNASSTIKRLCRDVDQMREKYHPTLPTKPQTTTEVAIVPVRRWSQQGNDAYPAVGLPGLMAKVEWALWGSREMEKLVDDVEEIVKRLDDLIPFHVISEWRAQPIPNVNPSKKPSSSRPPTSDADYSHVFPKPLPELCASQLLLPEPAPSLGSTESSVYLAAQASMPASVPASHDLRRSVVPAPNRSRAANSFPQSDLASSEAKRSATGLPTPFDGDYDSAPRRNSEPVTATSSIWDSKPTATAIALDQHSNRVAYILGDQVIVYAIQRVAGGISRELIALQYLPAITASRKGAPGWEGLSLAGSYLAAWGRCKESSSFVLHISKIEQDSVSGHLWLRTLDVAGLFRGCDRQKRVALSRRGFVAAIKGSEILVTNLNGRYRAPVVLCDVARAPPRTRSCARSVFLDIAFDEKGDLLYAWSMGGLHGALICWKITSTGDLEFRQVFTSFYAPDENQRIFHNNFLRLYPFTHNSMQGCVVGASSNTLFFACSRATSFPNQKAAASISEISCPQLRTVEVMACCIGTNGSFITLQRGRVLSRDPRIRWVSLPGKYECVLGNSQGGGVKIRGHGDIKPGLQIGAFNDGDRLVVGIFYPNGVYEHLEL